MSTFHNRFFFAYLHDMNVELIQMFYHFISVLNKNTKMNIYLFILLKYFT